FAGLFEDVDLTSTKLGRTVDQKNRLISEVIKHLDEINFGFDDTEMDVLGDAYEYLIGEFAAGAGKKAGEFYTPQQVSKILSKIVTLGKERIRSAYDPTCGSGSLLLRVAKESNVSHIYGQELNTTTYNLARMNMILHGVKFADFDIEQGDTLEEDRHVGRTFEAVVANPPFSANWSADQTFLSDERFSAYGKLAPKTKADFAFVQHMIHHLDEDGVMATVLPHGVLFRGAAEGVIREYLVKEKNYLDAVIGLPANIFYGTSIPTCILVFKKHRENSDNVLFVDASNLFQKNKNQNMLTNEHVEEILRVYEKREAVEKFSHLATMEEIAENDYNLNIPRYVDTFEEEEEIDLEAVANEIGALDKEIESVDAEIKR
ncbi:MAG: type I restriction-modification system subunit M, partial [Peptostreptococcaceae bacterium]